ncbi:serine/threonine-protein kinase [Streptomyces chilikensis]|uniref:Serine/threonine-protein kinase n=1 Tax=Streptomyces chilikensis TaxID=1194079 RepID=A0ABV3EUB2_9ACTN
MEMLGAGDPERIGSYRLLARLGAGGMGRVYLARSDRGRTVAVKLVRPELAEREEFRARFRREVRAARRVGGDWTAPVLDADTGAAVPWVATGYVAGPSLERVVGRDHGALPERTVRILAAGLARALRDIHGAGLVHRDLKPSNVLITIDGPRVIDFGIARALEAPDDDSGLTRAGAVVGSPGFMAPEQVRGERVTAAVDVFSLGSVLAYASTGRLPFGDAAGGAHALMYRIAQDEPDLTGVPEGLSGLVGDCLRKDAAARPSLEDVLERVGAEHATLTGGRTRDPWLPAALVAQLGRHAAELLEVEDPGPRGDRFPTAATVAGAPPLTPPAPSPPAGTAPVPPAPPAPGPSAPGPSAPGPFASGPYPPGPSLPAGAAPPPSGSPVPGPFAPGPSASGPHPPGPYAPGSHGSPPPGPTAVDRTPPPDSGGGARTAVVVAAATLAVALVAGGAVYGLMRGDDRRSRADGGTGTSASASPSPSASGAGPVTTETTGASRPGAVPEAFLGEWSAVIENASGSNPRRMTLSQGEVGDPVLRLVAEGPLAGTSSSYRCVFEADLAEAPGDGGGLRLGPSRVVDGAPLSSCSPGDPSTLTLTTDGSLDRRMTTGDTLTYHR